MRWGRGGGAGAVKTLSRTISKMLGHSIIDVQPGSLNRLPTALLVVTFAMSIMYYIGLPQGLCCAVLGVAISPLAG
jgi:hypothetical protein